MGKEKQICMKRSKEKGRPLKEPCLICGERRETHVAHFPKKKSAGGIGTINLCPTHHFMLEHGRISRNEAELIRKAAFSDIAQTPEEFINWAYNMCYSYSLDDLKRKYWEYKR